LTLILRQGAVQVALGLLIGVGLALLLAQGLGILLFGVEPWDPGIFAGVVAALALTAIVACFIPARRATRVDPVEAMRYE
jgi:putative ABC transport system permease protein